MHLKHHNKGGEKYAARDTYAFNAFMDWSIVENVPYGTSSEAHVTHITSAPLISFRHVWRKEISGTVAINFDTQVSYYESDGLWSVVNLNFVRS